MSRFSMSLRPLLMVAPAAFAAGLLLAAPAFSLDRATDGDLLELAQAAPATPAPPPAAGPERHARPAFNPKSFCLDRIAKRAGNRTFLKIKLDLKADQMAAWDAFAKASDTADAKDTERCNALPTEMKERPSYVDRLTMEETMMKARIERIEAVKPTLVAFYDKLSPEQKAVLDRPQRMGMKGGHHRGHGPR